LKGNSMTKWITDVTIAPHDEWVLGAIPMTPDYPDNGIISEVIIFDSGFWTDTRGEVVEPLAWARIEPFTPVPQRFEYDWESNADLQDFVENINDYMPFSSGVMCIGIIAAQFDSAEAALIIPPTRLEGDEKIWWADAFKDILGDAQHYYQRAVDELNANLQKH